MKNKERERIHAPQASRRLKHSLAHNARRKQAKLTVQPRFMQLHALLLTISSYEGGVRPLGTWGNNMQSMTVSCALHAQS